MYYLLLSLSIGLHLFVYFALYQAAEISYQKASLEEVIKDIAQQPRDFKQVVLYTEAPEIDITSKEETSLLSKKKQRVREQSLAPKIGKTENRSPNSQLGIKKEKSSESRAQLSEISKPKEVDFNRLGGLYAKSGTSTIGEKIYDDIPIGNFTALNTDQYSFYSFTERVDNRIRSRWTSKIERSLKDLKQRGLLDRIRSGESTTLIEVMLDKNGNYKGATLYKSSGQKAWDEAAIHAFQDGSPFVNPPKEMLEENDMIRLRYSFSVIWNPKYARHIR